jgi:aminopeptidase
MDPRVEEHARILVEHSADIGPGDEVLVSVPPVAEDLLVALNEQIAAKGAFPVQASLLGGGRAGRALVSAMDPEAYDDPPEALQAIADSVDAAISVRAATNTREMSDVPPETHAALQAMLEPVRNEIMDKRWVGTQYPAPANAQEAEMSTDAYADFVYDAVTKDWAAQREFQSNLVDILEDASTVRIVSGETTDIELSIDGMEAVNDYGETNLPGGEVFTAPVPDSVAGEVTFDMPVITQGVEITDAYLLFEDGEVVEHSAEKNEDTLTAMLETDDGARRLGELGIGMNRDIDRFTYNMLFDEKMGDTVHLALGMAYDDCVGPDREGNDSAIHTDMIVDMSEDSRIEVDGEVIQRDGTFRFEDGFEQ